MARTLFRDQVERFYELEEAEYSRNDIASLCAISASQVHVWRKEPPQSELFPVRPDGAPQLPAMRPKKPIPPGARPEWMRQTAPSERAKRPPPLPDGGVATPVEEVGDSIGATGSPKKPGHNPRGAAEPATHTSKKPAKGPVLPETHPPGGKKEAARQGALRPVTTGQLEKAVAKQLREQKAEMLREIKAAGFDPAVAWTTDVDEMAFNPVKALVQLAHVPGCPEHTVLGILRELIRLRKERAKIAWEGVKIEDVPLEYRSRLAGMLVEYLPEVELPEEVTASEAAREVYELTGVALPGSAADAFLLRWESALEGMRTDAEALVPGRRAEGRLAMDGPPPKVAEFRVRPATGAGPT